MYNTLGIQICMVTNLRLLFYWKIWQKKNIYCSISFIYGSSFDIGCKCWTYSTQSILLLYCIDDLFIYKWYCNRWMVSYIIIKCSSIKCMLNIWIINGMVYLLIHFHTAESKKHNQFHSILINIRNIMYSNVNCCYFY